MPLPNFSETALARFLQTVSEFLHLEDPEDPLVADLMYTSSRGVATVHAASGGCNPAAKGQYHLTQRWRVISKLMYRLPALARYTYYYPLRSEVDP